MKQITKGNTKEACSQHALGLWFLLRSHQYPSCSALHAVTITHPSVTETPFQLLKNVTQVWANLGEKSTLLLRCRQAFSGSWLSDPKASPAGLRDAEAQSQRCYGKCMESAGSRGTEPSVSHHGFYSNMIMATRVFIWLIQQCSWPNTKKTAYWVKTETKARFVNILSITEF